MKFRAIRLRHVRRFGEQGLALEALSPGLNVLARPNEFGKSTILDALKAGLFLPARSTRARRFIPTDSSADPYLELEFEGPKGSFRLQKRFAGGRKATMTRLTPLAGSDVLVEADAEARLANLVETDSADKGQPSLLWASQGAALDPDLSSKHASTLSDMVASHVVDVAAGDDLRGLMTAAQAALSEVEDKRGKAKGPLADILGAIEEEDDHVQAARSAMARAEALADDLARVRRRANDLSSTEEDKRLREELRDAEQEAQRADIERQERSHTEQFLAQAQTTLDRHVQDLNQWEKDLKDLENKKKDLGMATHEKAEAEEGRGRADAVLKGRRVETETARLTLQSAETQREKVYQADVQRRQSADRARLEKDLESAKVIVSKVAELRPLASLPPVDLDGLHAAEREVVKCRAALEASSPWLRLDSDTQDLVILDGDPLTPGQSRSVVGEGRLTVGAVHLTIGIQGREQRELALRNAEQAVQERLKAASVANSAEAMALNNKRQEARQAIANYRQRLAELAPDGVDHLAATVASLSPATEAEDPSLPPLADIELTLQKARADLSAATAAEKAATDALGAADKTLTRLATRVQLLEQEAKALADRLGPADQRAQKPQDLRNLAERARDEVGATRKRLNDLIAQDNPAAAAKLQRLKQAWERRQQNRSETNHQLGLLQGQLDAALGDSSEAALQEASEKKAEAEAKRDRLEKRRAGLKLLIDELQAELNRHLTVNQAPVMEHLTPMIDHVFGGGALRFDSEWKPVSLERTSGSFEMENLSHGTQEQLALLTRFAFAKLAAKQGHPVPLILDDPLIYADDERVERVFDLLHDVAAETQVIVLTCHERLFDRLGGHRLEPQPFPETV